MSAAEHAEHPHEIIIVKHGHGDHDEGHHGGVWKIAFADFMTAMMCFFLVMWLISASDEKTKASVASYFNPVKLIDRTSSQKGLEDIGDGPNSLGSSSEQPKFTEGKSGTEGSAQAEAATDPSEEKPASVLERSDAHLFADPYAVLAEIAADTGAMQNISSKGDGGAQDSGPATGASGGESYRDPFAPDFWSQQVAAPDASDSMAERTDPNGQPAISANPDIIPELELPKTASAPENRPAQDVAVVQPPEKPAPLKTNAQAEEIPPAAKQDTKEATEPKDDKPSVKTEKEAAKIEKELAAVMRTGDKLLDGLSVVATNKGVTISVTDQFDFGMFEVGSALPRRELVLAMEKIGKTLSDHSGAITINGHTDARPFKSANYDNWRLSTSRAHSAYYMLVRAGLDEKRIKEVGGFADRQLKVKDDPFSSANRRIEIILDVDG